MKRAWLGYLAILATLALAASACGDDDGDSTPTDTEPAASVETPDAEEIPDAPATEPTVSDGEAGTEPEATETEPPAEDTPATTEALAPSDDEASSEPVTIGLLYSNSGPGGVLGPPAERALRLAVQDINSAGGVNGSEVQVELADTATDPAVGRDAMARLVSDDEVDVVIGIHSSATREAARPLAEEFDTLYLYGALYEGAECSAVMFNSGEVPAQQLGPAIPWIMERTGGTRWFLLGNDYVWPRKSFEAAKRFVEAAGGEVVGEQYVPLGTQEFGGVLADLAAADADLILPALVGGDAIAFELQAPDYGVGQNEVARLANIYEEGVLAAMGPELTAGMVVSLGYVKEVDTAANREFVERYVSEFGEDFPPNTFAAHVYELALLWAGAANEAGTTDAAAVSAAMKGRSIDSVRGTVTVSDSRHLAQPIFLVEIASDGEQVIVETFEQLDPAETCAL